MVEEYGGVVQFSKLIVQIAADSLLHSAEYGATIELHLLGRPEYLSASGSHGRDRSHGRVPARSVGPVKVTARQCELSKGIPEDLRYVVAFKAELSQTGCAGSGETPLFPVWSAAPDVGNELACLAATTPPQRP